MKVLGVIAEYNPFHFGHYYHLQKAKELTGASAVICIIGSSFLQRGEPALVDKWARCQMALHAGADLILELPIVFSCRSALWFAMGGVKSLASTGIITHLAFGAETTDLNKMQQIARILNQENSSFVKNLEKYLDLGYSYPKSRSLTLQTILNTPENDFINDLDKPNNILALAYLQVLESLNSKIEPVLIKRLGHYHSLQPENGIASATAIRKLILEKNPLWYKYVPESTKEILTLEFNQGKGPVSLQSVEQSIMATIRRKTPKDLKNIIEVKEGLENRIWQLAQSSGNITSLIEKLKTKRYTYTRMQRLLTHIFIRFTNDLSITSPEYLRVLGFNSKGQELLQLMKTNCQLPIITKFAQGYDQVSEIGKKVMDLEARATDLYTLAFPNPQVRQGRQDFYRSPIII
ncbi:MAG: hypothetical protein PWQ67_1226 [Clostridia bacterium]|nr:hypothetical protein [Clostridia bacterium]MDN5322772.1 hypothetical protein [Clostridia bacterium]